MTTKKFLDYTASTNGNLTFYFFSFKNFNFETKTKSYFSCKQTSCWRECIFKYLSTEFNADLAGIFPSKFNIKEHPPKIYISAKIYSSSLLSLQVISERSNSHLSHIKREINAAAFRADWPIRWFKTENFIENLSSYYSNLTSKLSNWKNNHMK